MRNFIQGHCSHQVIQGEGRRHLIQKSNHPEASTIIDTCLMEVNKDLAQDKILEYANKNALTHIHTLKIIKDWQDSDNIESFLSKYENDPEKFEIAKLVLDLRGEE